MRIDSGLQGYYHDQGRFQRPSNEVEETVVTQAAVPGRTSAPGVESSTLLSSALSGALWAIDGGRRPVSGSGFTLGAYSSDADDLADAAARVSAHYLQDDEAAEEELLYA